MTMIGRKLSHNVYKNSTCLRPVLWRNLLCGCKDSGRQTSFEPSATRKFSRLEFRRPVCPLSLLFQKPLRIRHFHDIVPTQRAVTSRIRVVSRGYASFKCFPVCKPYVVGQANFVSDYGASNPEVASSNGDKGTAQKQKKPRTLDQVMYHIQADIRRKRRIHKAEIHNGVDLFEAAGKVGDFGSFFLNCCCDLLPDLSSEYRVRLGMRIWKVIQTSKEYSKETFEAILKVLARNEDETLDPFEFLREAENVGIIPTATMYFFALQTIAQRGDIESCVNLLTLMKDKNVPVNEEFFNLLILAHAMNGDLKGAEDIVNIMKASKIEPSNKTWTSLLRAYIEVGDLPSLKKTFLEIGSYELTEEQLSDLIKAAGRQPNAELLDEVIQIAVESRKMHHRTISSAATQLMYMGHPQHAVKLLLSFSDVFQKKTQFEPFGSFFIKELHATNPDPDAYLSLIMSLQHERRNPYALNTAAESCLKHKKLDLAYKVFEGMMITNTPIRPHYFNPAFLQEFEQGGTNGAVHVLKQMSILNVAPDWEMLVNWIVPRIFLEERNMVEVARIINENSQLSYSSGILSAVLVVALQECCLTEILPIIQQLQGKIIHPEIMVQSIFKYLWDGTNQIDNKSITILAELLKFIVENVQQDENWDYVGYLIVKLIDSGRVEAAERLLHAVLKMVPFSPAAVGAIEQKIKFDKPEVKEALRLYNGSNSMNSRHIHPSDMDKTALECHREELESKDMNARGVCRKLFLKYCQSGDLNKALEIKRTFEHDFGDLSNGMKSALLGVYVKNSLIQPGLDVFLELKNCRHLHEVDTFKIIDLAALMAENGRPEDAVKMIQEECQGRTTSNPDGISRNITRLLENLSKATVSTGEDEVNTLTEYFIALGFLVPSNANLGPSIRHLIRRGELDSAVSRLELYSKEFRLTPCLQELTYEVLNKPDLLDRVLQCSTITKGPREAKRLFALAKSDVGDLDGAAAIFRELGNQLSFQSLINQCEYLASRKELVKMINLINSVHKTERNYDCSKLYRVSIQACKRSGDTDGLKKILLNMEDRDVYVPPNLKQLTKESR